MNLSKCVKKIIVLILFSYLSACSNKKVDTNYSNLQTDFDAYQYSNYVKANLKPENVNFESTQNTSHTLKSSVDRQKLISVKNRLANNKKRSTINIANTISNNGLYKTNVKGNESLLITTASLDNVIALALQNNLDIKGVKEPATASLEQYDQVEFLEDMLNQYAAFTQTKKQPQFPFPGLISLKSSIIDQSIETQRLRFKQKVQDVITQTRISYNDLQFARAEVKLLKKDISLLNSLKKELQNNYSSNTGNLDRVLQVDIDLATSRNNLQTIKNKIQSQQIKLNTLLNRDTHLILGQLDRIEKLTHHLEKDNAAYVRLAKKNRIEISVLSSELAQMDKVIQLSQRRLYPNIDAGFSRLKKGKFSKKPFIKTNKVLAKDDAYLTETKAKRKALKSKIEALKTKTIDDIQQYLTRYKNALNTHSVYINKIIPKSKVVLDIANNRYETGETTYENVINVNKTILSHRINALRAKYKAAKSKIQLERIASNS